MRSKLSLAVVAFLSLFSLAHAEPYLAVKQGLKCSACHTNPTGGGRRNNFGNIYGQTLLPSKPTTDVWTGKITDRLHVGGDLRVNLDGNIVPDQSNELAFEVEEAILYLELELLKDQLTLYLDERVAPGSAFNREAYGLFKFNRNNTNYYAKAGRFFLPFGFRLEDDTGFVKQVTAINYDNPDTGVEVGAETNEFSVNLAITNGTAGFDEVDTGKQISLRTSYVKANWRIGVSANFNDLDDGDRTIGGLFGGLRTGPVQWLGEVALISDNFSGSTLDQLAIFTEANIEIRKGQNLKATYEYLDPNRDQDEDGQNRYSAVYEWFPRPFVQANGGIRIREGIPQSSFQNADEVFLQMHLFF